MSLLNNFVIAFFTVALSPSFANAQSESGPSALAAHFMKQFYDAPANTVSVSLSNYTAQGVTAVAATADGHTCTMDMAPAPASANAPYGWLVGSMQCKQGD